MRKHSAPMQLAKASVAAIVAGTLADAAMAATHTTKRVRYLHSHAAYPCATFQLDGVPYADNDASAGNPWFSLNKSHPHFAEQYALLLSAQMAQAPVTIVTSGSVACNNPEVLLAQTN